jgi:hypothetical protein
MHPFIFHLVAARTQWLSQVKISALCAMKMLKHSLAGVKKGREVTPCPVVPCLSLASRVVLVPLLPLLLPLSQVSFVSYQTYPL